MEDALRICETHFANIQESEKLREENTKLKIEIKKLKRKKNKQKDCSFCCNTGLYYCGADYENEFIECPFCD